MPNLSNTQQYTMDRLDDGYSLHLEVGRDIKCGVLRKKGEIIETVPYRTVMWLLREKFIGKKGKYFIPLERNVW